MAHYKDTLLPAEVEKQIKKEATDKSYEKVKGSSETVYARGFRSGYETGYADASTAYAIKLQEAQQEIESLKRWKEEAKRLLDPILDYGQSKEAHIPVGESITNTVLERSKRYDRATQMLFRLTSLVNAEQKPDEKFLTEIKTFLEFK